MDGGLLWGQYSQQRTAMRVSGKDTQMMGAVEEEKQKR